MHCEQRALRTPYLPVLLPDRLCVRIALVQACSPGTYQAVIGQTQCNLCGAGHYSANILSCEKCALGEYCEQGTSVGVACPQYHTTLTTGSAALDECVCKMCVTGTEPAPLLTRQPCHCSLAGAYSNPTLHSGFFMNYDSNASLSLTNASTEDLTYTKRWCEECPSESSGYDCSQPGNDLVTLRILPGFWRSWSLTTLVQKCYHPAFCLGAGAEENATTVEAAARRRRLNSHQPAGGACVPGHQGPFCALCVDNYIRTADGSCTECTGSVALSFIFPGIIILLVILLAIRACRNGRIQALADAAFDAARGGDESVIDDAVAAVQEEVQAEMTDAGVAVAKRAKEKLEKTVSATSQIELARSMSSKAQDAAAERCGCTGKRMDKVQVKVRILISLVQVITQLGVVFSIPYPDFYTNLLSLISVFSLDLFELMPFGCSIPYTHDHLLLFRTLIPIGILVASIFFYRQLRIAAAQKRRTAQKLDEGEPRAKKLWQLARGNEGLADRLISCNFILFYLLFPSNSAAIFATLQYSRAATKRARRLLLLPC